jgi:hypothetical protein
MQKTMQRLIIGLTALLPLVFWMGLDVYTVKVGMILVVDFLLLLILFWQAVKGRIAFVWHKSAFFLILLPFVLFTSAFFSGSYNLSVFGDSAEVGTVASFVSLVLLMVFVLSAFANKHESPDVFDYGLVSRVYLASSSLLITHFLFVSVAQYGWLKPIAGLPITLMGSYIDLSIILGLGVFILSLSSGFNRGFVSRALTWFFVLTSLLIIGAVGYLGVQLALIGLLGGGLLVRGRTSKLAIVSIAACVVLLVGGAKISAPLAALFRINNVIAVPSSSVTAGIAFRQWKVNFVTGAGPNRFAELWSLYKPFGVKISFLVLVWLLRFQLRGERWLYWSCLHSFSFSSGRG